jgi:hypothetical protein
LLGFIVMRKLFWGAIAALALTTGSASAATSLVVPGCSLAGNTHGCLFNGGIDTNANFFVDSNSYVIAELAYNFLGANPDIDLNPITAAANITGGGTTSGTWSLTGYTVDFIAVGAGNYFDLYQLSAPGSNGNWSTIDIPGIRGTHPKEDYLVFFGTKNAGPAGGPGGGAAGVPEPASWLMMLAGFGLIGAAFRTRKLNQFA